MGKCERCGVELERAVWTSMPVEAADPTEMHHAARCADRLKTQRDEALARAEKAEREFKIEANISQGLSNAVAALRAELEALRADARLGGSKP